MRPVAGSESTNTGVAPRWTAGPTVATKVSEEVTTRSPGPTPSSAMRRSSAAVPEATAAACCPASAPRRRSNSSTIGPHGAT